METGNMERRNATMEEGVGEEGESEKKKKNRNQDRMTKEQVRKDTCRGVYF